MPIHSGPPPHSLFSTKWLSVYHSFTQQYQVYSINVYDDGDFIQWHSLPFWRPAANVDPLFRSSMLRTFRKVSIISSKNSQWQKKISPPNDTTHLTHTLNTAYRKLLVPLGTTWIHKIQFPLGKRKIHEKQRRTLNQKAKETPFSTQTFVNP
jgi:hypothetical protein